VDEVVRRYRLATAQDWRDLPPPLAAPGEAFRALVAVLSKLAAPSSQKDLEETIASLLRGASPSDEIVRRLAAQLRRPPEE
jgi:hypothetical protein